MTSSKLLIVAASAVSLIAGVAGASTDVGAQVKDRQAHFKTIGRSMKGLADALKAPSPAIADIRDNAKRIDDLAPQLPSWFPPGSGPESGAKTAAKPDVWAKPDAFRKDAADFAAAAHKLDLAATAGDVAAVHTDFAALGDTCKACHQTFRVREH